MRKTENTRDGPCSPPADWDDWKSSTGSFPYYLLHRMGSRQVGQWDSCKMSCGEHMEVNALILGQKGIGRWKSWCMQAFLQGHLLNESLNRSGSQDMKSSNILAEGEDFSFLPSASPHHSLLSVGSKGEIQAWFKRAWDIGTAWPFLLITKHAISHNCEPRCPHMRDAIKVFLGSCQQFILSMATHIQWSDGTGCNHTELCVLTEFLYTQWYYTPVIAAPVLPQDGPCACLSLPLLINANVCNLLFITSLTKKCLRVILAILRGFLHSTAVSYRIQNWGDCVTIWPPLQSYQEHLQPCSRPKPCHTPGGDWEVRRWLGPCIPECSWDCLLTLS